MLNKGDGVSDCLLSAGLIIMTAGVRWTTTDGFLLYNRVAPRPLLIADRWRYILGLVTAVAVAAAVANGGG